MSADFVNDDYFFYKSVSNKKHIKNSFTDMAYLIFKRLLDICFSFTGILFLILLLFTIGLLIKIDSKGHVFYTQTRVGRNYKNFKIIKFRTMLEQSGLNITSKDDNRITRIGRYLRTMKLDELPQLINVLLGDMSLVGPRPEIPEYVNEFILYNSVLTVRPGITDYASIKYKNEEEILFKAKKNGMDMIEYYKEVILFDKIKLNLKYIKQKSLTIDLFIIIKTLMCLRKG